MTLLDAVMVRMEALNMTMMLVININVLGLSLLDRGTPENLPTRKHAKYTVVKIAAYFYTFLGFSL